MEEQLFSWEEGEFTGEESIQYYNCTLKVDIGLHKAGDLLYCIELYYGGGVLRIWNKEGNAIHQQKLILSLGETVKI